MNIMRSVLRTAKKIGKMVGITVELMGDSIVFNNSVVLSMDTVKVKSLSGEESVVPGWICKITTIVFPRNKNPYVGSIEFFSSPNSIEAIKACLNKIREDQISELFSNLQVIPTLL